MPLENCPRSRSNENFLGLAVSIVIPEITRGIKTNNNNGGFADFQLATKTVATTKQLRLN